MCTPPLCQQDEVYYCPGTCPGGCGTGCATVTPGPTETATPTATSTSTPHELYLPFIAQRSSGEGFQYESSECLNSSDRGESEQVEIRVEGRDVVMEHRGVVYNCCATMVIDLIDQRPRLQLVERETYSESGPCRCVCPYDLKAWIRNLPAGTYDVEVWDERRTHLLGSAQVTIQ